MKRPGLPFLSAFNITPGPPPTKLSHESVVKEPRRRSGQGLTPRTAGQEKLGDSSEDKALLELA